MKNLPKLKERPAWIQGDIFEKVFEIAELKQLTTEDMEKYEKSVLEYYDVRDAMECAREEGREEGIEKGIEKGRKEGVEEGIEKGIKKGREEGIEEVIQKSLQMNIPIEIITELTGYSKEQIISYSVEGTL